MEIDLTLDEIKLIRKCLQSVSFAHTLVETAEGTSDRDTPIDALIRKFREVEEHEGNGSI